MRGMILHKIMEEFVTGELEAEADAVRKRSRRLLSELSASSVAALVDSRN